MDPAPPMFNREQMMAIIQMLQSPPLIQQQALPQYPNNPMGMHMLYPGLMSMQTWPPRVQQAMSVQSWQTHQHPQQLGMQLANLPQTAGTGYGLQLAAPTNADSLSPRKLPQTAGTDYGIQLGGPTNVDSLPPRNSPQPAHPGASSTHCDDAPVTRPARPFMSTEEDILARVIHESHGENLEETIGRLEGVNGHTTAQWISHYLKNSKSILQKIKQLENPVSINNSMTCPPRDTRTAPSNSRRTRVPRDIPTQTISGREDPGSNKLGKLVSMSKKTRRSPHIYSPYGRKDFEKYRSHSPTPPATFSRTEKGGNRYTPQDAAFFKAYTVRALWRGSGVLCTRSQLAEELAQRVPHHSVASWYWYICRRHNGDIIKDLEQNFPTEDSQSSRGSKEETDAEGQFGDDEDEAPSFEDISLSSSESDGELHAQDAAYIKRRGFRSSYLPSERRALAKYMAYITRAQWDDSKETWSVFQKKYNSHSVDQWRKWYRCCRKKSLIDRMVKRFEIRDAKRKLAGRETLNITQILNQVASSSPSDEDQPKASGLAEYMHREDDTKAFQFEISKPSKPFTWSSEIQEGQGSSGVSPSEQ